MPSFALRMKQHPSHADWFWWLPVVCEGQSQAFRWICSEPLPSASLSRDVVPSSHWSPSRGCMVLGGGMAQWQVRSPGGGGMCAQVVVLLRCCSGLCPWPSPSPGRSSSRGPAGLFQRALAEKSTSTSVSADSLLDDSRPSPSSFPAVLCFLVLFHDSLNC